MTAPLRVLFDTPILVDLLMRRPKTISQLRSLADRGARIAVSTISVAEIYSGIHRGEEAGTARLFDLFDVISLSAEIARLAGELASVRRNVGRAYSVDDMAIAATAIKFNYSLYTTSKRDFEVPGIMFYAP